MPSSAINRIWALALALILGNFFVVVRVEESWTSYWLLKDGQQGTALVTRELWSGHDAVAYQYRVGQNEYTGEDARSYQNPKFSRVMPGEHTIIYFSSSHPWLSAIDRPISVVPAGLPVLILAWLFEALLIITVVNPKHKYALSFHRPVVSKKPDPAATS